MNTITDSALRLALESLELPLPYGYQYLRLGKAGADLLLPIITAEVTKALDEAASVFDDAADAFEKKAAGYIPGEVRSRLLSSAADDRDRASAIRSQVSE